MGERVDIITALHKKTSRDYLGRMADDKIHCMEVARRYGRDFWDGDRRYGYGGYRYDGRWNGVARSLAERHGLGNDARILDVGCGKGFLLHEFREVLPKCEVRGFDVSEYAIENSKESVREFLSVSRAQSPYPYPDKHFDLVVSLNALHNLQIFELGVALSEMQRVGKKAYLTVESFRNETELFNLQCWALTCEAFHRPEAWEWMFQHFGFEGDYEFIFFE